MNAPRTPHLESADQPPLVLPRDELHWYMDAVIYQLNVKAFFDSNDDGIGDFPGLTSKLGYVKDLGVNTIWLMPFYPSPLKDDGYDISNYLEVNPQFGTLEDFRNMLDEAHRLELRVITELVINHTSDQHPWFQAARRAPAGSPERDFYVWSDDDDEVRRHAHHLHRHRVFQLDLGPGGQGLLLASLLQPPARPELRQPQGARGGVRHHALLARHGRRRLPARRDPLSHRARRHQQREPAGDA